MTDYTELKRLAEAATQCSGPRRVETDYNGVHQVVGDGSWKILNAWHTPDGKGLENAQFTAAASPTAVLALIDENDAARKELGNLRTDNAQLIYALKQQEQSYLVLRAERDQLKAENEALRKERADWQAECLKRGFEYVRESDDHYVLADLPEMADLLGMLLGVEVRTKDNDAYEEANSRLNEQVEGLISTIHKQESMRKDAERWRFVRNPTATGSPFAVWSERTNLFLGRFADEAIDAAMGKGDLS